MLVHSILDPCLRGNEEAAESSDEEDKKRKVSDDEESDEENEYEEDDFVVGDDVVEQAPKKKKKKWGRLRKKRREDVADEDDLELVRENQQTHVVGKDKTELEQQLFEGEDTSERRKERLETDEYFDELSLAFHPPRTLTARCVLASCRGGRTHRCKLSVAFGSSRCMRFSIALYAPLPPPVCF